MKKFIITTSSTCITEYVVEADNEEDALELYFDGEFLSSKDVDFQNEDVITVKEEGAKYGE